MQTNLPSRDLVLIGAGHTNMHVARMWRMRPISDVRLTIISPFSRATYSGMLPGTLAGLYEPHEMEIDLYRFGASCGARIIIEEVTGFDPDAKQIHFADRPSLRYDIASIGIGSVPNTSHVLADNAAALSIKPMATFLNRLNNQLQRLQAGRSGDDPLSICVIGAGAAGVEVTLCLQTYIASRSHVARFCLVDSGEEILKGYLPNTRQLARRELERREVAVHSGRRVSESLGSELALDDGTKLPADVVITATSATPPQVLEQFQLPRCEDGFLAVRPTLQSTENDDVFVVGDTASFVDNPVPKAGVYAVRQGPVLWQNIQRRLQRQTLRPFQPQRGFLSLLATGDGKAIGQYRGRSFHNRLAWKWKDYIDRKFMRMYQDYRPMAMQQPAANSPEPPAMRCRGCGGKVGGNVLSAALERLQIPSSEFVRQGLDHPDDAALLNPQAAPVEVVSVDFFQAFMDDPYLVGRVAALNALSDIWAMGGTPRGAMAMVTIPAGKPPQQVDALTQLLAGGLREFSAVDVALLGGHTTEGDELMVGYTVLGDLGGNEPLTKAGLTPGERLILTKPLGSGVLLAGHAQALCRGEWIDEMLAGMLRANHAAVGIARKFQATAVTDVTGFGLAGHLLEMLDASGVGAELSLAALPQLSGFEELSSQGVRSSLDPANRLSEDQIKVETPKLRALAGYQALFDPQTSGGILMGIPAAVAQDCLTDLADAGFKSASVVGTVTTKSGILTVCQ